MTWGQVGRGEVWACRGVGGAHQVSSYGVNFSFRSSFMMLRKMMMRIVVISGWSCERMHDDVDDVDYFEDANDIRETVREGWVSEVAEGQFPYLYFWPCWLLRAWAWWLLLCNNWALLTTDYWGLADRLFCKWRRKLRPCWQLKLTRKKIWGTAELAWTNFIMPVLASYLNQTSPTEIAPNVLK